MFKLESISLATFPKVKLPPLIKRMLSVPAGGPTSWSWKTPPTSDPVPKGGPTSWSWEAVNISYDANASGSFAGSAISATPTLYRDSFADGATVCSASITVSEGATLVAAGSAYIFPDVGVSIGLGGVTFDAIYTQDSTQAGAYLKSIVGRKHGLASGTYTVNLTISGGTTREVYNATLMLLSLKWV